MSACPRCVDPFPVQHLIGGEHFLARHQGAQHAATQLGQYYGVTVVSIRQFHWAMLRDNFPAANNMSECFFLSLTYRKDLAQLVLTGACVAGSGRGSAACV